MRAIERVLPITRNQRIRVLQYLLDSVLACGGPLLVTGVILVFHLHPLIPNITILYLLVVLGLAIMRGRYAAILSAVVAFFSLDYLIVPPLYNLFVYRIEEEIELFTFLIVAMLTGQLAAAMSEREKQAKRQAEQEAQAQAGELSAIFEAMTEGVSVCDARGEIRYTNTAYRSLLALEEDFDPSLLQLDTRLEWLAIRDLEGRLLSKEQYPLLRVLRGERLSGAHSMDVMCCNYKGENIIFSVSGAPIRDATGQVIGGVVVFRDVTRQRHIAEQLQYSEQKLRSLVESNIFGVVVVDIDGRFYEANDRFVQMIGYSKEELLSGAITWQQLNLPEYQEVTAQAVGAVLSTGAMHPYEKEHLHKDGSRAPILIAGAMIDQERELVLMVILDISERKEIERRKQEFLSMVSHELRTPLTSIMGLIELALMQIELHSRSLPPEAEGLLKQIEKTLKRADGQVEVETRLVEELLEVSRLELHKFELVLQRENLVTIVQETVANQQQAARARQIELVLPPEELVPMLADACRIGQVLTNYLTNALKYAPVDQPVSVCLKVEASSARVSVCDQGPGLTEEQQQRVWERFYQVAAPGQRGPDRGLGLGLAIARAIVEQHQGQVGVQSAPGHGSTFWFTLPIEVSPKECPTDRN